MLRPNFIVKFPPLTISALILSATNAQNTFPAPSIITGDGPRPPNITAFAPTGTWVAPTANVTVSGTTYAPPSMTGIGKQAQIVAADNFCLYMPPDPITENLVDAEAIAVAYCFHPYNDTRPMPDGFITKAHWRMTPDYVQVTGTFDWTKMNLNPYDCGGEYDNHGAEGFGNPVGAHVDGGDNSYTYCRNTFDLMGCLWVMPGDYQEPGFTNCQADSDLPVGVYNASYTFAQGDAITPPPVAAPSSSSCTTVSSPTPSGVTYSWAQLGYSTGPTTSTGTARTTSVTKTGDAAMTRRSGGLVATLFGAVYAVSIL